MTKKEKVENYLKSNFHHVAYEIVELTEVFEVAIAALVKIEMKNSLNDFTSPIVAKDALNEIRKIRRVS